MSLAPYSYRPATPPEVAAMDHLKVHVHRRNFSDSSYYSNDTSPEPSHAHLITPSRSPVQRQHGPTLLPKIRTQDSVVESSAGGPKRNHRRALSTARNPSGFAPYSTARPQMQRSVTEPLECTNLISPVSTSNFYGSRATSVLESPVTFNMPQMARSASHSRNGSSVSVDESTLTRYGYPTYRQMPLYVSQAPNETPSPTLFAPTYVPYQPPIHIIEATPYQSQEDFDLPMDLGYNSRPSSMTPPPSITSTVNGSLLTYLTEPTQPVNLVRHLTLPTGRGMQSHFWWDIRNLRSWSSFSLSTISTIPGLLDLLNLPIDTSSLPSGPSASSTITPGSESDLANLITKIYFPKVNSAAQLSQGSTSLSMYAAPPSTDPLAKASSPHFLANYSYDSDRILSGLPRGRLVGLTKSFDRWNTGMRHEGPARKVDYLNGLAHLQKCMRDHSCRYGFILTEIELVCVRAGCDDNGQPYFGYLELADAIATKTAAKPPVIDLDSNPHATPEPSQDIPLTVSLALYYLLMLAKATPLPGQANGFMDVGGPGAMTRQRVWDGSDISEQERGKEGRDKWIPEPQVGEKRDAKRTRGWIWPADPWHKREGAGAGRRASKN